MRMCPSRSSSRSASISRQLALCEAENVLHGPVKAASAWATAAFTSAAPAMGTSLVTTELSFGFRRLNLSFENAFTNCPFIKSLSYAEGDVSMCVMFSCRKRKVRASL